MRRQLPISSKLGFGVGQLAEGITTVVFGTFTLFFFNQIIGVSATLTATALAVAMVFDAVSDPLAGSISDRLKSRWGRRLPMMASSSVPLAVAIVALFNPPAGMHELFYFGWLVVFAVLARLFLTLYHVPHMALGAEIAHDYTDRTRVFSYSQAFSTLGTALFAFLMYSYIFPTPEDGSHGLLNAAGYPRLAGIAAAGIVISISLCVWGTKKEVPYLPVWEPEPERLGPGRLWREVRQALGSVSYRMLLSVMVVTLLVLGIEGTFMAYLYVHFWELNTEQMRWLGPMTLVGLPISVVLIPHLTKKFDKRALMAVLGALVIINLNLLIVLRLFTNLLPENGDTVLFVLFLCSSFVSGLLAPAMLVTFNSMFADVADELELREGVRQEGIIYSARSFAAKAAGSLATIIGGVALDLINFPKGAEVGDIAPETIYYLGLIAGPPAMIIGLAGLSFYLFYELSRERMEEIAEVLLHRREESQAGEHQLTRQDRV
jgi:GPH family glycoside/pentoside/hexuronide:cation symporter